MIRLGPALPGEDIVGHRGAVGDLRDSFRATYQRATYRHGDRMQMTYLENAVHGEAGASSPPFQVTGSAATLGRTGEGAQ